MKDGKLNIDNLIAEFDEHRRILHITASSPIHVWTLEQGRELETAIHSVLTRYLSQERGYLIADLSKIIIEPDDIQAYAQAIQKIADKFLFPDGFARYGFEIGRVTAQMGHQLYLNGNPNLFNTKKEAFAYIRGMIESRDAKPGSRQAPPTKQSRASRKSPALTGVDSDT